MIPPIYPRVAANVTSLGSPVRFYPFGQATQQTPKPYAVYQIITGTPENYLGQLPDIDNAIVQVDVYADTASQASSVADDIRDAVEPVAHMTGLGITGKDPQTQLYRYRMDFSYWVPR